MSHTQRIFITAACGGANRRRKRPRPARISSCCFRSAPLDWTGFTRAYRFGRPISTGWRSAASGHQCSLASPLLRAVPRLAWRQARSTIAAVSATMARLSTSIKNVLHPA